MINAKFPNRMLYLFDTFNGFDKDEFEKEMQNGFVSQDRKNDFDEGNEKGVLELMPNREKCIIRKVFPNTYVGFEEIKFSFVSIDVDLEESIDQSLLYFCPRLNEDGAIFVHDNNNRFYFGAK